MNLKYTCLISVALLLAFTSCKKKDDNSSVSYYYAGSSTAGDVTSFNVNETVMAYTVFNESNRRYDNGSFTIYDNELKGLYKVYAYGAFYYAVENKGQVFTGNFPTARLGNNLSFGVSQYANATDPRIAGDYVYFHVSKAAVNGSTYNREWGILSMLPGGTWRKQAYCNDTGSIPKLMPDEYTGPVPPVNQADSGTWTVSPLYPNRLHMTQWHSVDSITGFPYAGDSGCVFVMDMGFGHGFLVGLKLLGAGLDKIKGNYGFADFRINGGNGGGKITVNDSTHNVEWWRGDSFGKVRSGVFGVLNQCSVLKNVFFTKNIVFDGDTVDYYAVVSGPYFMEFQFGSKGFRSCGTGARLP